MQQNESELNLLDEERVSTLCSLLEDYIYQRGPSISPSEALNELNQIAGALIAEKTPAIRQCIKRHGRPDLYTWRVEMLSLIGAVKNLVLQKNNGVRLQAGQPIK